MRTPNQRKPVELVPWGFTALILLLIASSFVGCTRAGKDDDDDKSGKKPATNPSTQPAEAAEGQKVKLTAEAIEKYGVKVGKAKIHVLTPTFVAPARAAFNTNATARVGSVVPGRVVDIKVQRGDQVAKGDALLIVESTDFGEAQSDYLLKRTTLETAAIAIEPLKSSYERAKKLLDQSQGISLSEVQKREAELRAAQSAQQLAQGALSAAERKLSLLGMTKETVDTMAKTGQVTPRYTVRAPIAGRVIEREVVLGQFIMPDKDSPILLADMATLWVLADVPEARLADLTIGAGVRVTVAAIPGTAVDGTISSIAPSVDPATRTIQVRVEVKGNETLLKPGMFAQVEIDSITEKEKALEVIAVPESAIQTINGQTCVFVKDDEEENTFIKRPVAIGQEVGGLVPILSGLEVKEVIVKSGGFILKAEAGKSKEPD